MSAAGNVRSRAAKTFVDFLHRSATEARQFGARWKLRCPGAEASVSISPAIAFLALFVAALAFDPFEPRLVAHLAPAWRQTAEWVTRLGLSGYIFLLSAVMCLAAIAARHRGLRRRTDALLGLLAGRAAFVFSVTLVSGIASQIVKHLVGRARPKLFARFGAFHFDPFSVQARLASFPSGHTVTAFAAAAALSWFVPKLRIPLYIVAIAVALSRLVLAAHFPSDVVAGAALGLGTTEIMARAWGRRRIVFAWTRGQLRVRGGGTLLLAWRRHGTRAT